MLSRTLALLAQASVVAVFVRRVRRARRLVLPPAIFLARSSHAPAAAL